MRYQVIYNGTIDADSEEEARETLWAILHECVNDDDLSDFDFEEDSTAVDN